MLQLNKSHTFVASSKQEGMNEQYSYMEESKLTSIEEVHTQMQKEICDIYYVVAV